MLTAKYLREFGTQTDVDSDVFSALLNANFEFAATVVPLKDQEIQSLQAENHSLQEQLCVLKEGIGKLTKDLEDLERKNQSLEERAKRCFGVDLLEGDDGKTRYYTGLATYASFETVFKHTSTKVKRKKTKLGGRDELLLTLVKLRLNLGMEDLSHRFGVSVSLVNTVFHVWLDALYMTLGGLVRWPETDRMELPECFRNPMFSKTKCIIDCTEVFIERPSSLKARAQTYSNYKRHNTVKVLIGISPSGCVTFLSKCWGGRASDRKITEESGLLNKLVPGDVVMADRGFTMVEDFALRGAKLIMPAFTKGKRQLSAKEVEESRLMSRARIHVERVIGRTKDFKILNHTLPISLFKGKDNGDFSTCEKLISVVCGIVNTNPPLL